MSTTTEKPACVQYTGGVLIQENEKGYIDICPLDALKAGHFIKISGSYSHITFGSQVTATTERDCLIIRQDVICRTDPRTETITVEIVQEIRDGDWVGEIQPACIVWKPDPSPSPVHDPRIRGALDLIFNSALNSAKTDDENALAQAYQTVLAALDRK